MTVIKAEALGFCKGGRDSIEGVKELTKHGEEVFVYGYLLHNEKVISGLKKLGVNFLEPNPDTKVKGKLVIRAHGISHDLMKKLSEHNEIADYTCPQVYKIHALSNFYQGKGYHIAYLGTQGHPEAEGTLGNLTDYTLISSLEEAKQIKAKKIAFIAQSTCSVAKFDKIAEFFNNSDKDVVVVDTVCESSRSRQEGARALAKDVDVMVVIGGRESSNTKELVNTCKPITPTVWVESPEEIDEFKCLISHSEKVGLSAGASTPDEDIEELYQRLKQLNEKL